MKNLFTTLDELVYRGYEKVTDQAHKYGYDKFDLEQTTSNVIAASGIALGVYSLYDGGSVVYNAAKHVLKDLSEFEITMGMSLVMARCLIGLYVGGRIVANNYYSNTKKLENRINEMQSVKISGDGIREPAPQKGKMIILLALGSAASLYCATQLTGYIEKIAFNCFPLLLGMKLSSEYFSEQPYRPPPSVSSNKI